MAFGLSFGVALFLSVWSSARSDEIPEGALQMECRDHYLMIAADVSFAGKNTYFEAIDQTGVHTITEQYAAKCGYTLDFNCRLGFAEFRASYFSCHTENKGDDVFIFKFNVITHHEGRRVSYALSKTCSPSVPWSPREVICEKNYMEVSVRSEIACRSVTKIEDWDSLKPVLTHSVTSSSDWQVMFQRAGEQMPAINTSQARKRGYFFDSTNGRLVFRAPYGQPESHRTEINGVPVEKVHATVFSRQRWMVLMVDLVAACSMHEGLYDDAGFVTWETPELLYPSVNSTWISLRLNGELVEQPLGEDKGYIVPTENNTILVSIPNNDDRGYRKSLVTDGLYEFYFFQLYFEQVFVDENHIQTTLWTHRTLVSSLLPCQLFTDDQTVHEEQVFTFYLGNIPEDVSLACVTLNRREFMMPLTDTSSCMIIQSSNPNATHGYTLKVPFDDPVVTQQVSTEDAVIRYRLDINFTLIVEFKNDPYYYLTSILALSSRASPLAFESFCFESGISFKLDHHPSNYLWELCVGPDLLTTELAIQSGYVMSNDSQDLLLYMPLFTHGFQYTDVTMKGFSATFKILLRNRETSEVGSVVKTCPFISKDLIMCSTDGRMTVVVDLSPAIPRGGSPATTNLRDNECGPKEVDGTKAMFSFSANSCGSTVKFEKKSVTYENSIFYNDLVSGDATEIMVVQCTYPLVGLHRLFLMYRFESDTDGVGSIFPVAQPTAGPQSPTTRPTTTLRTTTATKAPTRRPFTFRPAYHPSVKYIKVSKFPNFFRFMRKGQQSYPEDKYNYVHV